MPSRRSDRGGALKRQLARAETQQTDLAEAIEARQRFEAERDYTYRVGFEEWDNLDTDTRQDLIREAAVFGGLSNLAAAVTSPRRLGVSQGAKSLLSKLAPKLAKAIYGRAPSKSSKSLMDRIKKVRADRSAKQKAIREIEKDLEKRYREERFTSGPNKGEKAPASPYPKPATHGKTRRMGNEPRQDTDLEDMIKLGYLLTRPAVMNARAAWMEVRPEEKKRTFEDALHGKYREMDPKERYK